MTTERNAMQSETARAGFGFGDQMRNADFIRFRNWYDRMNLLQDPAKRPSAPGAPRAGDDMQRLAA